jgi:predicted small lipoprotein YifL
MRWIPLILLLTMAATCGQKGPLTLPEDQLFRIEASYPPFKAY